MEKNNTVVVGLGLLIIGLVMGYGLAGAKSSDNRSAVTSGDEVAPGSVVHNVEMMDAMSGMMMGLEGKSGDEFDRAFINGMILHHRGAINMAESALRNSKRPELRKLAEDIIEAQTKEITQMKSWRQSWF